MRDTPDPGIIKAFATKATPRRNEFGHLAGVDVEYGFNFPTPDPVVGSCERREGGEAPFRVA